MMMRGHLNVACWHKADACLAAPEGPITSGLPTFTAEYRFLYRCLGQALRCRAGWPEGRGGVAEFSRETVGCPELHGHRHSDPDVVAP